MPQANEAPNTEIGAAGEPDDTTSEPEAFIERRCWRCLKMFPGDAPAGPSPTADFWLCDPCDAALIPQRPARH